MKNIYCRFCGKPKNIHYLNEYDVLTGEKLHILVCNTEKCPQNCLDNNGHDYGNFFMSFFTSKCKKCGCV